MLSFFNINALFFILALCGVSTQANSQNSASESTSTLSANEVIDILKLEAHVEGGYFRRTFQADHRPKLQTEDGPRFTLTSIYYLLTAERPVGHFHLNKSDIIHFFHEGDAIEYFLISPQGELIQFTLGRDLKKGQVFQYTVPGGWWKASRLSVGEYGFGLISEAVAPGFEYKDMTLGKREALLKQFPQHKAVIESLTYRKAAK